MIGVLLFLLLPVIEETIPPSAFAYPGLNPREIIVVDPKNAPIFDHAYDQLKKELKPDFSEHEILTAILHFIREKIFDLKECTEENIHQLIGSPHTEIPLDHFLKERKGVCRHFALTCTLFLHRLCEDKILQGTSHLIREELPSGRHAWCLFITPTGSWHIDPYWDVLENIQTEAGFFHLCQMYGKKAMEKEKSRWTSPFKCQ